MRCALVTGASGDVGAAICQKLAQMNFSLAVHYRGSESAAQCVADGVSLIGGVANLFQADLTVSGSARNLVDRVAARFGRIDVLVNNAGRGHHALLAQTDEAEIHHVISVNLLGAMTVTRAAIPHFHRNQGGVVINISSIAASRPLPGNAAYVVAKAGIEAFTLAMSVELGSRGVRVNAVAPGILETRTTKRLRQRCGDILLRQIALQRFGTPRDVAAAVGYLASPEAAFVTGHILHVDGGWCSHIR